MEAPAISKKKKNQLWWKGHVDRMGDDRFDHERAEEEIGLALEELGRRKQERDFRMEEQAMNRVD